MLQITWTLGPKPEGNWYPRFDFKVEFLENPIYAYNPYMHFYQKYRLPKFIGLSSYSQVGYKDDDRFCYVSNSIEINWSFGVKEPKVFFPIRACLRGNKCSTCNTGDCFTYLVYIPDDGDYENIENIFRSIADDIRTAWEEAVHIARRRAAIEQPSTKIFYTEQPIIASSDQENRKKISRKIKV